MIDATEPTSRPRFVLSQRTMDCILPVPPVNSWEWIKNNSFNHKGQPFNYVDFPWCRGICDAWDSPKVRRIFFMAGSRLGKTELGLALMQCAEFHDPDVGMIVGSTEGLIIRTIGDRFYKMLEKSHATRHLCPPPHRRAARKVNTRNFKIYGAWSGSPTTLGDLDPRYLEMLEVDKFTKNASEEADPFLLAMERGAEIPDRKLYAESTPTIEGQSRIGKHVAMGTNRRFHVPCPCCSHYQELVINRGTERDAGGLWWDRDKDGLATANQAAATAVYVCERCKKAIHDEQRRPMVRRGVWCASGQRVKENGTLEGTPANDGPDESFQLSRMYGPTFSFGEVARAYVSSRGESENERSFDNNWSGVPWIPIVVEMTWEKLAKKLCVGDWEIGTVPKSCIFLTTAVDVQVDHFVLTTFGWDREKRGYLIQHGTVPDWDGVQKWLATPWKHLDGGPPTVSRLNLIDAKDGNRKDEIVDFCRRVNNERSPWIWPSMGARPGTMHVQMFRKSVVDANNEVGKKANKSNRIKGLHLITVNTTMTQEWLDNAMVRRVPGDPMSITLPTMIEADGDLFQQLLNERYNPEKNLHIRVDETTIPVDFRDCFRYARAAAEAYTNGNWERIGAKRTVYVETLQDREQRQVAVRSAKSSPNNDAVKTKPAFIRQPKRNGFLRKRG